MVAEVDASALLIYRAAWTHDVARRQNSREAAIAKLYATEAAQGIFDKAVQMFGGLGVVKGEPVESLYREIRDRKSTRLNSSHQCASRMPSSAWKKKREND